MSLTVLSSNFLRVGSKPGVLLSEGLWKSHKGCIFGVQTATIKSKAFKEPSSKPPPFPYMEKRYSYWRRLFDRTTSRIDENSKIILVEGPVAIGKTKFAKQLACDLDMHHIGDANMDTVYVNKYGFDLRTINDKLPLSMQTFDEKDFCRDPRHLNAPFFQLWMYRLRYSLYIDALAHVLSTGQGVVIERSPWSDKVFAEAMAKSGFLSANAKRGYYEIKRHTIPFLLRPHVIIYLDAPVSVVKEKIKKRCLPHEQNSPALTDKFLQDMEDEYKTDVLTKLSTHAELLMYDWSEEGDIEAIVEDIERLDFDSYSKYDTKMIDWCWRSEELWNDARFQFADNKEELMSHFNIPYFDAPEFLVSGEDQEAYDKVVDNIPQHKYAEGFNPLFGETGLLFKSSGSKYIKY